MRLRFVGPAAICVAAFFAFTLFLGAGTASAISPGQTQEQWEGKPICGGAYKNGSFADACEAKPAKKIGKARGDCPNGSFFDLGTWSCYSCPNGYDRTANSVTEWDACSKKVPAQRVRAKYMGPSQCRSNEINDPRNGGECWTCPSGYGRTLAAIDAWDACGAAFKKARKAEFQRKACKDGFFDPRKGGECWSCPRGFRRTASAVDAGDACIREEDLQPAKKQAALTCEEGDHFDLIDGGTCWRCPEGYDRSWSSVKARDACISTRVDWDSPERKTYGFFDLPGAEELAVDLITDQKRIDKTAEALAKSGKVRDVEKFKSDAWATIKNLPQESLVLKAAAFDRLLEVVKSPNQAKPHERQLLDFLSVYIQDTRALIAKQSSDAYYSWKQYASASPCQRANRKDCRAGMSATFKTAGKPPEIDEVVGPVLVTTTAGAATFGAIVGSSVTMSTVAAGGIAKALIPFALEAAKKAAEIAINQGVSGASTAAATASTAATAVAGPLIIVTGAAILAGAGLDIAIAQMAEEGRLDAAIREAQRPVRLEVLTRTDEGLLELTQNWAMMTQDSTLPQRSFSAKLLKAQPVDDKIKYLGKPLEALEAKPRTVRLFGTDLCLNAVGPMQPLNVVPCAKAPAFSIANFTGRSGDWRFVVGKTKTFLRSEGLMMPYAGALPDRGVVPARVVQSGPPGGKTAVTRVMIGKGTLFKLEGQSGKCMAAAVERAGAPVVSAPCDGKTPLVWEVVF